MKAETARRREKIAAWLRAHHRSTSRLLLLGAGGLVAFALIFTTVLWTALTALVAVAADFVFPLSLEWCALIALGFIPLYYLVGLMLEHVRFEEEEAEARAIGGGPDVIEYLRLLDPEYSLRTQSRTPYRHPFLTVGAYVLFAGPRALRAAWLLVGQAWRRRHADVTHAAAVLSHLAAQDERVPFGELMDRFREMNVIAVVEQLRGVEGVMVLGTEPPGLTLTTELRQELRKLRRRDETAS